MSKRKKFGISKNLTESLSQTIHAVATSAGTLRYEIVPLEKIQLDPNNPRKLYIDISDISNGMSIDDSDYQKKQKDISQLESLKNTILDKGVLNPIWLYKVDDFYRVAVGERRVLASCLAGKSDIPAKILDSCPNTMDLRLIQWIENIERVDLLLWEKLNNIRMMIEATKANGSDIEINATYIKSVLGCSLPHAMNYLAAVNAGLNVQSAIKDGVITSLEKAAVVAKMRDKFKQNDAILACRDGKPLKFIQYLAARDKGLVNNRMSMSEKKTKRGRKSQRIYMGSTKNPNVAKRIINSLLQGNRYRSLKEDFTKIDWSNYADVTEAFGKLLQLIEKTEKVYIEK